MTPVSTPIQVQDNPAKHRFEYSVQGEHAVAIYSIEGNVITFIHTLVPDALRGQGIATKLVLAGLASARERGLRVIAQCPVFAAYMRAHPETHDLLADEGRALLGL
ncbi:GNAT family N-acetyltransferase [Pandoraea apista]|uniref:Acetyltransferase n=1 Tax=Pandoraea apista TaxID=93218 RepID=A0A0B5F2I6_9BURK|nr:GNAT family N-acetyltransferase [Pandoraea apista]AJE97540.1 acetyltransferase [Pandoraea apista]AKH71515.1 acetyltransferase [Pandoraea apista]AKI63788.1 acetyltransferase [Pandoraea apista]ALS67104.1 N-acetyltransferase [Pandoraea apista]AVF42190.1 N-acetyltransferase [Pandoraea apista]